MDYKFEISGKQINNKSPTFFIADIAANHDGDVGRAIKLIELAKENGADAVKFQHFSAKSIVSDYGFKALRGQKSHQSGWKKTVYEVYEDASINLDWTKILKRTCDEVGIEFMTSPYDIELVDHVNDYISAYKIGSGDITWLEIIRYIASKNKPYILATGASDINDVCRAVSCCTEINQNFALLQCNTNYTGSLENMKYINLKVLNLYRTMFPELILGLSDHTPGHATVLGAIALGGKIIEKHFTDDCSRSGPDHGFSMNPAEWKEMVDRSRELESALGVGIKKIEENELQTAIVQRRSIRAKRELKVGHKIARDDLEILRPCPEDAIPPYKVELIIGKRLSRTIQRGDYLRIYDFEI